MVDLNFATFSESDVFPEPFPQPLGKQNGSETSDASHFVAQDRVGTTDNEAPTI